LEQHGFARNKIWIVDEEAPPLTNGDNNNKASVDLLLKLSDDDLKCWPHWYDIDFFGAFASP
jgi:glucose-6-phosphate 1-epimerase